MSPDHRVYALFLLITTLEQYVVSGTKEAGQAALRRSGDLSQRFRVVAQGLWTCHAQNARVAASMKFRVTVVKCFNEALQTWAEEVTRKGILLQLEPGSSSPVRARWARCRCLCFHGLTCAARRHQSNW